MCCLGNNSSCVGQNYVCTFAYDEAYGKVCSELKEDFCHETHRFRPSKNAICSMNTSGHVLQFSSLCSATVYYYSMSSFEAFTEIMGEDNNCEMLKTVRYPISK